MVPWTDINISFLDLPYDCLVINYQPKEKDTGKQDPNSDYKRVTIINRWGPIPINPYAMPKKKTTEEEVKEFIGLHLSKDHDTYMCLFDDTHAMYFTRNYAIFIDEKFVKDKD
jgi:hypothetical protein